MVGSITPLPVMMEEEEVEREKQAFLKKQPPASIVVRYGYQKKLIELKYEGETTPVAARSSSSAAPAASSSARWSQPSAPTAAAATPSPASRCEATSTSRAARTSPSPPTAAILREATRDDELEQQRLDELKPEWIARCKSLIDELNLDMKLVDVEPLLGGERVVFYYLAENTSTSARWSNVSAASSRPASRWCSSTPGKRPASSPTTKSAASTAAASSSSRSSSRSPCARPRCRRPRSTPRRSRADAAG